MKEALPLMLVFTLAGLATAAPVKNTVDENAEISAVGGCMDDKSLEIANITDRQARYACFENQGVQQQCGMDGRTARLNAFRQWMANLDQYQKSCEQQQGTFSFKSMDFHEPTDETYCSAATVEVSYGAFENPICNFVSRCPPVDVVCTSNERDNGFRIPAQAILLPGVPVAIHVNNL